MTHSIKLALVTFSLAGLAAGANAVLIYDTGHGDLEFNYVDEGSGLEFEGAIHSTQHGHTAADGQIIRLDAEHATSGGTGAALLGTTNFWRIWQDSTEAPGGAVDLGFSAEETNSGVVDNNWIFARLVNFTGPGHFVLWRDGFTTAIIDTQNGLQATDEVRLTAGAHFHRNFGFSQAGDYKLTFKPYAFVNGQQINGDEFEYTVQVVPEPATLAALGLGTAALIRRRRKSS